MHVHSRWCFCSLRRGRARTAHTVTLQQYNEEKFWKVHHNFEPDFVLTVKQYMPQMPQLQDRTKPDLFIGPITNPTSNLWFEKVHKVSKERASAWLVKVVEQPPSTRQTHQCPWLSTSRLQAPTRNYLSRQLSAPITDNNSQTKPHLFLNMTVAQQSLPSVQANKSTSK